MIDKDHEDLAKYQDTIEQLFLAALSKQPAERSCFLAAACAELPSRVKREVEALLAADDVAAQHTELFAPVEAAKLKSMIPAPRDSGLLGQTLGKYEISSLIGEGGFGTVYSANRVDYFDQTVAIKVIRQDRLTLPQVVQRFELERQLLAELRHENIAQLLDGGCTDDGRPYFVMELITGQPITDYCDQLKLDVADRLRLFVQVCRAVSHAHQQGIVSSRH